MQGDIVSQLELPNRLWGIDAKELESMGFDPDAIRAHAMAELCEELHSVKKNHATASAAEISAVEKKIKDRHHAVWGVYSVK